MIKKLMFAVATLVASMSFAFAQVDVNKADASALDAVKGIGPSMSKTIIDARSKGGDFKDWADFEKRVKGVGDKRAASLSKAGLQVNGKSKEGAPMDASATTKMGDKAAAKADKAGDKADKTADKAADKADKAGAKSGEKAAKPAKGAKPAASGTAPAAGKAAS